MPPVILLALIGAAGLAGYRLLNNLSAQASRNERKRASATQGRSQVRDLGNLEWDESTGVYRPRAKRDS